jgi:hypothetical protein
MPSCYRHPRDNARAAALSLVAGISIGSSYESCNRYSLCIVMTVQLCNVVMVCCCVQSLLTLSVLCALRQL